MQPLIPRMKRYQWYENIQKWTEKILRRFSQSYVLQNVKLVIFLVKPIIETSPPPPLLIDGSG